jgi:sugar lactone lactonase YvrE
MGNNVWSIVFVTVLGSLLLMQSLAAAAEGFVDHGVAAPASRSRGAAATVDGEGNRVVLIWLADHRSCRSLLIVDATTGEAEQLEVPVERADSPFSVLLSSDNKWYSLFGSRVFQFDPATRQFTFVGDTPYGMAMGTCEDTDGVIWFGLYPNADLVSFDPKTEELTNYGPMNKENWPQYPSYMARDSEGWVYMGIGSTRTQVVAFNPETKEIKPLIPEDKRAQGAGALVYMGADGLVYTSVKDWGKYSVSGGVVTPCEGELGPRLPMKTGSQESVFRGFPDGSQLVKLDVPERQMTIQDADGTKRDLQFEYESDGSGILSVQAGPDGAIYGSTGHPLRVYRYDPATGQLTDHGLGDHNGHLNAMAVQRDRLYGAMYGHGVLFEYDVRKPWADTDKDNPNPRELARSQPDINRPHALLAHPDGRHVIMGGTPGYGLTGGGLHIFDLEEGQGTVIPHTDLVPNQGTNCLVALPDGNLLGGTTTMPGTGGEQLATEAELFIFDWAQRKVVWREVVLPERARFMDLIVAPNGLVYGIAVDSTFFVFDPATRQVFHQESLKELYGHVAGSQAPRVMALGDDGNIYVVFVNCIVRLNPETYAHEKVGDLPVSAGAGVALVKGRLYFATNSHLCSYGLPGLVEE